MEDINPDTIIRLAQALKAERAKTQALTEQVGIQKQQITELTSKTSYYDVVLACEDLMPTREVSKDYGWSAQRMNKWLEARGVQQKRGNAWRLSPEYADLGYAVSRVYILPAGKGDSCTRSYLYWTQKGRLFIYNLMKADGNYPVIEQ